MNCHKCHSLFCINKVHMSLLFSFVRYNNTSHCHSLFCITTNTALSLFVLHKYTIFAILCSAKIHTSLLFFALQKCVHTCRFFSLTISTSLQCNTILCMHWKTSVDSRLGGGGGGTTYLGRGVTLLWWSYCFFKFSVGDLWILGESPEDTWD